jgi:hypothetical protein
MEYAHIPELLEVEITMPSTMYCMRGSGKEVDVESKPLLMDFLLQRLQRRDN